MPSVTTEDVIKNFEKQRKISKENRKINQDLQHAQENVEMKLLNKFNYCQFAPINEVEKRLTSLNSPELKDLISQEFYNPHVMATAMCMSNSIWYADPYSDVKYNERLKYYLDSLRLIGGPSVYGYAMNANLKNIRDMFVVKASRHPQKDTLTHELFVGIYGTNSLRQFIPNFAYIYGGFSCSPPIINEDKTVATWCGAPQKGKIKYILYENITPSITFDEYIKTCSVKEFFNIYLQVLFSLQLALEKIDFTHYDLHLDNVLIRESPQKDFTIKYELSSGNVYLKCDKIATLIDFGTSHIKVDGKDFGIHTQLGTFADRSFPFHDAYKLFLFSMKTARDYNKNVYTHGNALFKFFNTEESLDTAVEFQDDSYYILPANVYTLGMSLMDYTEYILNIHPSSKSMIVGPSPNVLSCKDKQCIDSPVVFNRIMDGVTPDNVLNFYDVASSYEKAGDLRNFSEIYAKFDQHKYIAIHRGLIVLNEYLEKFELTRNNLVLIDLKNYSSNEIINSNFAKNYYEYITEIGTLYDAYEFINIILRSIYYVIFKYNLDINIQNYAHLVQQRSKELNILIQGLYENKDYLELIYDKNKNVLDKMYQEDPDDDRIIYFTRLRGIKNILPLV